MSGGGKKAAAAAAAPLPINASLNKLIGQLPMEQLEHSSNTNYATRFMPLMEKMMLEFEEDRRNIKKMLREIVGDREVPRTPKRNRPGALAWERINEYKKKLDFEEEDGDSTNFLDESVATYNHPTPLRAPPPQKTSAANARAPTQKPNDDSDGTLTDSSMATPPPGPSGFVTRVQASAEAVKKQKATTPAQDMDPKTPPARMAHPRAVHHHQTAVMPMRKGGKAAADVASATTNEDELRNKRKDDALRRREENLQAKAETAKRPNEERKRRVDMNRRKQEQEEREKEETAKAKYERVRQFQQQQRHDAQPFSPRFGPAAAVAAGVSQLRTPGGQTFVSVASNRFAQSSSAAAAGPGIFSPGYMAVPPKKQKATPEEALRAEATPTPVLAEVKRKQVRPQCGAAAKKINMDDEDLDEERRKLEIQMKAIREREAKEKRRLKEQEELERQRREDEVRQQQEDEEKEHQRREEEEAAARRHQEEKEESSSAAPSNATYTVPPAASSAYNTARTYVVDKTRVSGSTLDHSVTFPTFTVGNNTMLPHGDAFEEDQEGDVVEDTAVVDAERSFAVLRVKEEPLDIDEQVEEHRVPVAEMETDVVAGTMLSDDDDFHEQETEQIKENHPPTDTTQASTHDTSANQSTYDMTMEKVFLPATEDNYNVDDLSSNDETDDDENPRKKIPNWATKNELRAHVHRQREVLPEESRERYFGRVEQPSVGLFFAATKKKFKPRSSSAHWNSPMAEPTRGESRLKQLRDVKE